jgi:hypothetical protein
MNKIYKITIPVVLLIVAVIVFAIGKPINTPEQKTEQLAVAEVAPIQEVNTEEKAETVGAKVVAYYFYGNARCVTCVNIEKYAKEAVEQYFAEELQNGKLGFKSLNVETTENRHYIQDYQLYSSSLVLASHEDNEQIKWKNLHDVWTHVRNKEKFFQYVKEEIEQFLQEI